MHDSRVPGAVAMPLFTNAAALRILDAVAILLGQAYQLARCRMASASSPLLRMMAERDEVHVESDLLRRELQILRDQRAGLRPHRRPDYAPEQRLAILQLIRLHGWNVKTVADRFVLHPNTVRSWIKAAEGRTPSSTLLPDIPWNRINDAVRWAVHELRRLCPEPEFGTRSMARHLIRAGVQISRRTVQRALREPRPTKPRRPRASMTPAVGAEPDHLLTPQEPNRVWQLDLMALQVLWLRFTVAALLDGHSRKLLRLRAYRGSPTSGDMIRLVGQAVHTFGTPRFLISDHGCQFRRKFRGAVRRLGILPVRGRVRCAAFNGKVERLFRTLRHWQRLSLLPLTLGGLQRRLDRFAIWFNQMRPHQSLGVMTPHEAWSGQSIPSPIPFRAVQGEAVFVDVRRRHYGKDPRLPVLHIAVAAGRAA